jgi:nicotinic acid mononucleotide adenylyltransferase
MQWEPFIDLSARPPRVRMRKGKEIREATPQEVSDYVSNEAW